MTVRRLSLAAALAACTGSGVLAQPASGPAADQAVPPSAASLAGRWVHDLQGRTIGSVRGSADDGRTAVIMVGSYFQIGSHEARVPARALSVADGRVTMQAGTMEALDATRRR